MATDKYDRDAEREANYFAMCLLIPEQFLRDEIARFPSMDLADDIAIKRLARKFDVSVALMTVRLFDLGYLVV